MTDQPPEESLFQHLVAMLASSALHQLGLLPGAEGRGETDLEGASLTIDLLDALREKTKGNLNEDEAHMLKETLASLKMAFVQMKNRAAQPAPGPGPAPAPGPAPEPAAEAPAPDLQPPVERREEKQPRFHKKYD